MEVNTSKGVLGRVSGTLFGDIQELRTFSSEFTKVFRDGIYGAVFADCLPTNPQDKDITLQQIQNGNFEGITSRTAPYRRVLAEVIFWALRFGSP